MEKLHKDHIHLEKVFKILDQQVELLSSDASPDYYLMADITNYIQHYPDLIHHPKEDLVYDILKQRNKEAAEVVEQLQNEHLTLPSETIKLHKLLEKVISSVLLVSREEIQNQVKDFLDNERKHMDLEEEIIYPLIKGTLTEEDWSNLETLEAKTHQKADPLFSDSVEACYENLYQSIKKQGGLE